MSRNPANPLTGTTDAPEPREKRHLEPGAAVLRQVVTVCTTTKPEPPKRSGAGRPRAGDRRPW